ncbi:hypothetical protein FY036_16640 [Mesorhizobium microcysteis]|uniref:Uncharacterized protein n=1 Tax=Neoaquamicrobium microcysteis TaxID=2682781 RepID=A0A5D4GUT8_9HYPH|nr:hypothetical protein [Mesorhizobium microcysteis]TYR31055.1 hypothetical protein FY036_16640 [Mesorhizobium microcysteis]
MKTRNEGLLLLAGISLLTLAACGEEQETVVQSQEPPAAVEAPNAVPGEDDRSEDAMRRIGQGADAILQGAEELTRDARERAERLLEDSGPALERAGELAREIGASLDQITRQALRDFETGVALLQQRIDESTADIEPETGDPQAELPPLDRLRADTRAAAQAGPAGVGPDYVGVWAGDTSSCGRIDVEAVEMMAVITPTTMRRHENVCNFAEASMTDRTATLAASCIAEGEMEDRQIILDMPDENTIEIGQAGMDGTARLVRCHLP